MRLRVGPMMFGALVLVALTAARSVAQDTNLDRVLTQMDATAKGFHSLQAAFVWDQYTKVVQETETSKGSVYFQREAAGMRMSADMTEPSPKTKLMPPP